MLPDALLALCGDGVELVGLEEPRIPRGLLGAPNPEFSVLGADMTAHFDDNDYAEAMPGAWPLALDGGGGFYCLDLRAVVAGTAPDDGRAPVVWSHAGNLGWGSG